MTDIRVTYSGLVAFSISLVSVITGLIFTLIVTRRLSIEEFGLWTLLGSLISYVIIYEPIISFWVSRQIARGVEVGKTAFTTSGFFALPSFLIYIAMIFFVSGSTDTDFQPLLLASILVPLTFISNTLTGINLGHKPQAISYGLLFFEIFKIPVALVFVYFLELGIYGAIIAVIIAFMVKLIIQIHFAKPKLSGIFDINQLRYWIKLSWLPMYGKIPAFIWTLDVLIYSTIIGSVTSLAYYGAAAAVGALVAHAGMISQGLYPKLLSGGKTKFFEENFSKLLYFLIPLLCITIFFSKAGLFVLNPIYEGAFLIVIVFSIRAAFYIIMGTFNKTLQGLEKVDESKITKFSLLIKSKLFLVPTLNLIHYSSYVIGLAIMLLIFVPQGFSELDLILWWVLISLIIQIPFTIITGIIVYKKIHFRFPKLIFTKYLIGALVMTLVFVLTNESILVYDISIFIFLPRLILEVIICGVTYLGVTWLLDKKIRLLFKSILLEFTKNESN